MKKDEKRRKNVHFFLEKNTLHVASDADVPIQWNHSFKTASTFSTSPFFTLPRNWFLLFIYKTEPPMRDHPSFKTGISGGLKGGVALYIY